MYVSVESILGAGSAVIGRYEPAFVLINIQV